MTQTTYRTYSKIGVTWSIDNYENELIEEKDFLWIFKCIEGAVTQEDITIADPNPTPNQYIGPIDINRPNIFERCTVTSLNRQIVFISSSPDFGFKFSGELENRGEILKINQISNHKIPRMESIYNPSASANTMVFHGDIYRGSVFYRWFTMFGTIHTALT